jgi:hypothetical protein
MDAEQFRRLCKAHDLTYSYSDDSRAYNRGHDERRAIEEAAKLLPRSVAVEIWNEVVREKILPGPNGADMYLWQ